MGYEQYKDAKTKLLKLKDAKQNVALSYDKVWDGFPAKQEIHCIFQRKQKIRTHSLSGKSSDFVVVVHLQGLEPWAH